MEVSIAAANLDRMRPAMNKSKKDVYKIDNEQVSPFSELDKDDWDDLLCTNNPAESINR